MYNFVTQHHVGLFIMGRLLFECSDILHNKNEWVEKYLMVLMDNSHFIRCKFEAEINTNMFRFKPFIFDVFTFVKIVPIA